MSNKEQTAVELSEKQIRKLAKKVCDGHQHAIRYNNMLNACYLMGNLILQENKTLEKERIRNAWDEGVISATYGKAITFEQYYNETYGGNNED